MGIATATIETLTAEVKTLQVGSRQVTLSVYRQLDDVEPSEIEPFGRVNDKQNEKNYIYAVGRDSDGTLVRSKIWSGARNMGRIWISNKWVVTSQWFSYNSYSEGRGHTIFDGTKFELEWTKPQYADDERCGCDDETSHWHFVDGEAKIKTMEKCLKTQAEYEALVATVHEWEGLPLIVLAGLR